MTGPHRSALHARLIDVARICGSDALPIARPLFHIGRVLENDLVIPETTVSGRHATIEKKNDRYFLIDLKSTNGTLLNGKRLDPNIPYRLADGDDIVFDTYCFQFRLESPGATVLGDQGPDVAGHPMPPAAPEDLPPEHLEDTDPNRSMVRSAPMAIPDQAPDGDSGLPGPTTGQGLAAKTPRAGRSFTIGPYEATAMLGKGGFGSVWKARDNSGKTVAIKLLNPDALENQRAVRKFFHEAIILSKLNHPHICRFIDFFPHEDNYAIVMDFIEGTDLKTLLRKTAGPLPLETARRIAAQTLDAFDYAFCQNVLHRDIKPENIIWDGRGRVRVMDFGIAKLASSETQRTSVFMISTAYTAPERFDVHSQVDHRSDIYSLGLVFYEIFTGAHPFKCVGPSEMIFAHLNVMPAVPAEIAAVPETISDAILKAIEKDPTDRFSDFGAFRQAMFGKGAAGPGMGPAHSGALVFGPEAYGPALSLLQAFLGTAHKHQARAKGFSLVQEGDRIELVIEAADGKVHRLSRDLK